MLDELDPGLVTAALGGDAAVASLPANRAGRDLVIGDLHGMFRPLAASLAEWGFRPEADRLISVGDLVDRGPDSPLAEHWIRSCGWFHAVRGNHDQMLLDALQGPAHLRPGVMDLWLDGNGGGWWLGVGGKLRQALPAALAGLPFALEIDCAAGRVGIVHADVPPELDWPGFLRAMRRGERAAVAHAVWSRSRLRGYLEGVRSAADVRVDGIDLVVSGHVPLRAPLQAGNRWWIDTGVVASGRWPAPGFTLLQIHPGPSQLHWLPIR